jgi:5-hydroxyisourate hydrolase
MALVMSCISTHVLDVAQGKPAQHVPVRLERRDSTGAWQIVSVSQTDQDGRCPQLLPQNETLCAGAYRLSFDTSTYHLARKIQGLYPAVEITFQVQDGESHLHIPLLLSPHGYTTYRGS